MNGFPFSNFHNLNLDWILEKLRKAVFTINGQGPDDNGNINLAGVAGVTSVNTVGPDSTGNVTLTPADIGAMPDSYQAPVSSVNNKTGAVSLSPVDIGALPANYQPPVSSVNSKTGNVVLDATDVGAMPDDYAAPVQSVNGQTGAVMLDADDVGALPDTTVIPDRTSQLINDSGYITSQQAAAVTSVNGMVGAVVLDADDVGALPDTTVVPTLTSQLVNDSGFITQAQAAPVASVNGKVGAVVLDATDVGAVANNQLIDLIYPVGSIYMSVNSTSPATLFGGTWTQIKDTFLLSAGDNYTAGNTGGETEHVLTVSEIPAHTHGINHGATTATSGGGFWAFSYNGVTIFPFGNSDSAGSSLAHNNMPPYLVVYMWQRTA